MHNVVITGRELVSYFCSSLGYILATVFVAISAGLTFYFGHFFDRGVADLGRSSISPMASSLADASPRNETVGRRKQVGNPGISYFITFKGNRGCNWKIR